MTCNLKNTNHYLKTKVPFIPETAVILGTGLSELADNVENPVIIPYSEIPGFSVSTAPSHKGRLVFGYISGHPVVVMQGRLHYYEGYTMEQITYPIRVFKQLGVKNLIVTNASGSLNEKMYPGSLVILNDHINFMGTNPLIGKNLDEFGERFPSLHEPYKKQFIEIVNDIAKENSIEVFKGTYAAVTGPSLETRAECIMFQRLGADLVGMSTVPETIVAIHSGINVLGISSVTNYGNIFHSSSHSQEEIRRNAGIAQNNLMTIIKEFLYRLHLEDEKCQ